MLLNLHVKNLALIDETEIDFQKGLNILSGETGAGKSIVIGSVNLALGSKADPTLIRDGADYALVELLFETKDPEILRQLEEMELPTEDGMILITRKIQPGRSTCKVNGESVTAKQLRSLSLLLIDIHGQQEHHSLTESSKQLELLDRYAYEEVTTPLEKLKDSLLRYRRKERELADNLQDEATRKREQDLAEYEIKEIEEANLQEGEDDALEEAFRRMNNAGKITGAIQMAKSVCGYEEPESAGSLISSALRELKSVSALDSEAEVLEGQLLEIDGLLSDFERSAGRYLDGFEFDSAEFARVGSRLNLVNRLKDKYGGSIERVLQYLAEKQELLEHYANYELWLEQSQKELQQYREEVLLLCNTISDIRKSAAKRLSTQIREAMLDLNFAQAVFEIQVESGEEYLGQNGYDRVTYLVSVNPGESVRSLAQVASGGELSRIMLAFKTVLAQKDSIETLIFDEIDTGISGRTAWKVSEKIGLLAQSNQVICITHLPQIAAMADTHFLIEKGLAEGRSVTGLQRLGDEDCVRELARMLGSGSETESALANAREMLENARKTKSGNRN